ncbi:MAG TPA: hypothetical protein VK362_00105, partial [Reyranella sp.]|nr:hypothetical protein [Reyranella sp.]
MWLVLLAYFFSLAERIRNQIRVTLWSQLRGAWSHNKWYAFASIGGIHSSTPPKWREPVTTLNAANDGSEQPLEKSGVFARLKDFLRPFFLRARAGLLRRGPAPSWEQSFRVL